ncbi:hypothetical protein [Altererythrobacter sp. MF3-039]|uniref:hypothetical protein n=1 Tax=Altererythrobacter sp. MF3-039 TaxID=3252901 RepID=UPI00390C660A
MRPHETIRGRVLYTSRKPERANAERGREEFLITKHGDGRRTIRAHCEIDDAPNVMRDVVLTLDKDWITRDGFVRLAVGDETSGSSWYRFHDDHAICEGWLANGGRISQRIDYSRPGELFGAHPIQGDAWHLHSLDLARGPHVKVFDEFLMTSLDHRGATGPELVWHDAGMIVEFIGREELTVAAGTFDALHFCYGDRSKNTEGSADGDHPVYDIWVTDDGDYILLKAQVGGYMMTHYELTELERIPGDAG